MSNPKDNSERENIFELLDGLMFQLSRTKKMMMIIILTTLIIPPVALLVMTSVFDSPFHENFEQRLEDRLQFRLQNGEITSEEYQHIKNTVSDRGPRHLFLNGPQLTIFAISLVWLGIGIRQWVVLSKWDKRYRLFKKKQEDIDKKLEDNSDNDD